MTHHSEAFEKLVAAIKENISEIDIECFLSKKKANEPLELIDVREDHEYEEGSIEGAFHLGRGILERDIEKFFPDRQTPLILYCGGGYRSALACDSLQRMGYKNVRSLAGGFRTWYEKGMPVYRKKT